MRKRKAAVLGELKKILNTNNKKEGGSESLLVSVRKRMPKVVIAEE